MRSGSLVVVGAAAAISLSDPALADQQSATFNQDKAPPAFIETSWRLEAEKPASLRWEKQASAYPKSLQNLADERSAALKWEMGYLTLSAIDAGETIGCLQRNRCEEGNPIFGKHPSAAKVILGKVGLGLVHFAVFSRINSQNPKAAMRLAQISCVVQGGVVMLNARLAF